jgi:hypothetical protein
MRLLTVVLAAARLPFATFAQTQLLPNGAGGYNLYGRSPLTEIPMNAPEVRPHDRRSHSGPDGRDMA